MDGRSEISVLPPPCRFIANPDGHPSHDDVYRDIRNRNNGSYVDNYNIHGHNHSRSHGRSHPRRSPTKSNRLEAESREKPFFCSCHHSLSLASYN